MDCLGKIYRIFSLLFLMQLIACSSNTVYAPVLNGVHHMTPKGEYRVQRHDTLYSIAFDFGQDYRELALRNHIKPPYALEVGQVLRIKGAIAYQPTIMSTKRTIKTNWKPTLRTVPKQTTVKPVTIVSQPQTVKQWLWPVKGKVIQTFAPTLGSKGIDISGKEGEPIHVTSSGQVVYAGNGLTGYGNLIIVKHNEEYLTAYAHAEKILVHEGQTVKAGQSIALVGHTGTDKVKLHFEIRKAGKPVNPLSYLK